PLAPRRPDAVDAGDAQVTRGGCPGEQQRRLIQSVGTSQELSVIMASPADDVPDEVEFGLLNAYLEDLHAGRQPDRQRLLQEYPRLAPLFSCLESLDQLAVAPPAIDDSAATPLLRPRQRDPVRTLPPAVAASAAAPAGDLGKYQLLGELGRGGMGVVYKARQHDLDRLVALKMILGSQLATPDQVERFQAEARAAARLSHPNIVQVYQA